MVGFSRSLTESSTSANILASYELLSKLMKGGSTDDLADMWGAALLRGLSVCKQGSKCLR